MELLRISNVGHMWISVQIKISLICLVKLVSHKVLANLWIIIVFGQTVVVRGIIQRFTLAKMLSPCMIACKITTRMSTVLMWIKYVLT